ncbi:hypothetical protein Hanom_Chr09g00863621 [Helianthus anomalus]
MFVKVLSRRLSKVVNLGVLLISNATASINSKTPVSNAISCVLFTSICLKKKTTTNLYIYKKNTQRKP